jgi:hypothetical protein
LASTDKSNTDDITPEAITGASQNVAAPPQSAASNLPEALEPELRRIIDTAVARVAAIELEAIKEARELTQRSEQEGREALRFALDRAVSLTASLELLAATVNGMAEALKMELDDALTALRNVPEPESALSRELAAQEPTEEPTAEEPAPEEPTAEEPAPEDPTAGEPTEEPEEPAEEPQPAEPRIKLTPIVRPVETPAAAEQTVAAAPAEAEPERELATVGAPAGPPSPPVKHKSQPAHSRKGRVRRFFTR